MPVLVPPAILDEELAVLDLPMARTAVKQPDEPFYFNAGQTQSVLFPNQTVMAPWPYGGFCIEAMEAHGGLLSSAPDLCKFLDHYWITGQPRRRRESQSWAFFGSLWPIRAAGDREAGVRRAGLSHERSFGRRQAGACPTGLLDCRFEFPKRDFIGVTSLA